MVTLNKMTDEELIDRQQSLMQKRGEAEAKFKAEQQEVQFEIDKRAAKSRFGTLSPADRAALAELDAEISEEPENG